MPGGWFKGNQQFSEELEVFLELLGECWVSLETYSEIVNFKFLTFNVSLLISVSVET